MIKYLVALLFLVSPALAHDKNHPEWNDWYMKLKQPGTGISCCNVQDCHPTEYEIRNGEYWARLGMLEQDGSWSLHDYVRIPPEKVLKKTTNPTGFPIFCHSRALVGSRVSVEGSSVYCFIPDYQG